MRKKGRQTYLLDKKVYISQTSAMAGPVEKEGKIKDYFDKFFEDDTLGEKSYEKAEHRLCLENINNLLRKADVKKNDIDILLGGDLLNQLITTNLTARDLQIPFWGIYNACATFAAGLQIGSAVIENEMAESVVVVATSHYSTAERQYRFPLELGTQSPVTAQRTVTSSGACLLKGKNSGKNPYISSFTIGKVADYNQSDANDMGSAMAPSAFETIKTYFEDTGFSPEDYDMIVTGDLGKLGHNILKDMLIENGINISSNLQDCGLLIYDIKKQDVYNGGSGAGCSAGVFSGYLYKLLKEEKIKKIFLAGTGALLSTTSTQQKESIPCITHGVTIEI